MLRKLLTFVTDPVLVAVAIISTATGSFSSAGAASLSGVVQTGGTSLAPPLPNVNVTLFEVTTAQPVVLGQATTDAAGRFVIKSPKDTSASIFYASADLRRRVEFVTILGPSLPSAISINEVTTVAAGYSMAQFYKSGVISGNSFGSQSLRV